MNLLVLFPAKLYSTKVSPVRRHSLLAIDRRPDVRVGMSGVGWSDWDDQLTVKENVGRFKFKPDAILAYKPEGNKRAGIPSLRGLADCGIPVVMRYNECWWDDDKAAREIAAAGASLVILHHENDFDRVGGGLGRLGHPARIESISHCADMNFFYRWIPRGDRRIDAILTGAVGEEHYPLRVKWAEVIEILNSRGFNCKRIEHPGYRAKDWEACEKIVREFAVNLSSAKISLVCSSKWRYPLAKYVESAMSGCHVIGDEPQPVPPHWDRLFTPVDPGASPGVLADVVEKYLTESAEASAVQAYRGQQAARRYCTQEEYAEQFAIITRSWLNERQSTAPPR